MDSDDDLVIEKINRINGLFNKQENYYKKQKQEYKKQPQKRLNYQELFAKHFKGHLNNLDINVIIKDGKKMFRIYSKKTKKEFFQDYDCVCELLNFCENGQTQTGLNIDISV